jgi:Flp pilus assembly protein TadD
MKRTLHVCLAALALAAAGCKDKPAQNASEAEFAVQIRDFTRAEGLLAKAVELDSESPRLWIQLGTVRKRLDNKSGARKAYEKALSLLEAAYKRDPKEIAPLFGQMEVCVLLGKPDDAKKILEKARKTHADDLELKAFIAQNMLEAMIADPQVKAMAL